MNFRLSVQNLPPTLSLEEFREKFKDYKGLVNSRVFYNDRNEALYGELDFTTFECADYCKKSAHGYRFPGQQIGIITDYAKQQDTFHDYSQQSQLMDQSIHQNLGQNMTQNMQQGMTIPQLGIPQVALQPKDDYFNNNYQTVNTNYQQGFQQLNQSQQHQQEFPQFRPNQHQQQAQHLTQPFQKFHNTTMNNPPNIQQPMPGQFVPQTIPNQVLAPPFQNQPVNMNALTHFLTQGSVMPPSLGPAPQSMMRDPFNQNPSDVALFKITTEATNSLYVDGIPIDSNEREVAHIFRPFPGFQTVRLIKKVSQTGREFYYCFVDFENPLQSTIALVTLQGYRFSKNDKKGLKISYANEPHENKDFRKKNLRKK